MSFNIIHRPYIGEKTYADISRPLLQSTILADWYDEITEENRFLYRIGNAILSTHDDFLNEYDILVSKFNYNTIDFTKPFYANVLFDSALLPTVGRYSMSSSTDELFSDTVRYGSRINVLGEDLQNKIDELRQRVNNQEIKSIDLDDVDYLDNNTQPKELILNQLMPNEYILSGEQTYAATNYGRVLHIDGVESNINFKTPIESFSIQTNNNYIILPPLTIIDSIKVFYPTEYENDEDTNDITEGNQVEVIIENINLLIVKREGNPVGYSEIYDIDKDGYISTDDISFISGSVGKTTEETPLNDWANIYSYLDKDNDGVISDEDILPALKSEGCMNKAGLVFINPNEGNTVYIECEYFIDPYVIYATPNSIQENGSFNLDFINGRKIQLEIKDGIAISNTNNIVGINIERNQIYAGRLTDGNNYIIKKFIYPEHSSMLVSGITQMDNIAYVLLQAYNDYLYKDYYKLALLRIDMNTEILEYSQDIIPLRGFEDLEFEATGLSIDTRKDRIYIFTNEPNIYTIELQLSTIASSTNGVTYASQSLENFMVPGNIHYKQQLYNDIDNLGFNVGINRNYNEDNLTYLHRIRTQYLESPGNDLEGMYRKSAYLYNPSWIPMLYRTQSISLANSPDLTQDIKIILKFNNLLVSESDMTLVLNTPVEINNDYTERITYHTSSAVALPEIQELVLENRYYKFNTNDIISNNILILHKESLLFLIQKYIKMHPDLLFNVPNMDETLIYAKNVELKINYTAIDALGVVHTDLEEIHEIDLPPMDQILLVGHDEVTSNTNFITGTFTWNLFTVSNLPNGFEAVINDKIELIYEVPARLWNTVSFTMIGSDEFILIPDTNSAEYITDGQQFDITEGLLTNTVYEISNQIELNSTTYPGFHIASIEHVEGVTNTLPIYPITDDVTFIDRTGGLFNKHMIGYIQAIDVNSVTIDIEPYDSKIIQNIIFTNFTPYSDDLVYHSAYKNSYIYNNYISYYALHENYTHSLVGEPKWNSIIEDIRSQDSSAWKDTIIDVSMYNDKYNTLNIITTSKFDSNIFEEDIIGITI